MIFRAFVLCAMLSPSLALADPELDRLGTTGISGGVTHTSVKDQKSGEICWSYTLAAVAEASYRRGAIDQAVRHALPHGTPVQLAVARARLAKDLRHYTTHVSPEYLQFWHIYYQIKAHLNAFSREANALAELKSHSAMPRYRRTLAANAMAAYDMIGGRKPGASEEFEPDVGNEEGTGLKEAGFFGMVPDVYFKDDAGNDIAVHADRQEARLERRLVDFIRDRVLIRKNIIRYSGDAPPGVNLELYKDMNAYFHGALGLTDLERSRSRKAGHAVRVDMPLPTTTFSYGSRSDLTPLTYMREVMKFQPEDYVAFVSENTKAKQQLALEAIAEAMRQDFVVPVGIGLAADSEFFDRAQHDGLFSETLCPQNQCTTEDGGHEMSGVNFIEKNGEVTGLIVKNSWGHFGGRDVNGAGVRRPGNSGDDARTGYFIITAEYLRQTAEQASADEERIDDPWDFVLPKSVAESPRFKGKLKLE